MSPTPRKLRLNVQTVRQLTNQEAGAVVGGDTEVYDVCNGQPSGNTCYTYCGTCPGNTCGCSQGVICTNTCQYTYCGGCATIMNDQCCVDLTFSALRLDF